MHSLLWLKNNEGNDAPNYWFEAEESDQTSEKDDQDRIEEDQVRIKRVKRLQTFSYQPLLMIYHVKSINLDKRSIVMNVNH